MKTLKIDFQKTPKSKVRVYVGISLIILSAVYLILALSQDNPKLFMIFNALILILLGLSGASEGAGRKVSSYFGKAFILIDDDGLEFKPINLKSGTKINWMDVDSIKFSVSHIELNKDGVCVCQLDYAQFSYKQVQDIKSALSQIADKYGIEVI